MQPFPPTTEQRLRRLDGALPVYLSHSELPDAINQWKNAIRERDDLKRSLDLM